MPDPRPIAVAGEALIDLVPAPDGSLVPHLGGGPFNTARALGRLARGPVAFIGRISTDGFGAQLAQALSDDGVALDACERTDDPTTLALVELDARGSATYRFYTAGTAAPGLRNVAATGFGYLHIGTLGLALAPIADTLAATVAALADDVLLMVDPNCRPDVIGDRDAYRARLAHVLARADLVKVSEEDLAWLSPGAPAQRAAADLLAGGKTRPRAVLLTRGGAGATIVGRAGTVAVAAPAISVIDTIGAGDAFSAGWLAWWSERGFGPAELDDPGALQSATEFACRVAARTCERAGASPPTRAELDPAGN